MHQLPDQLWHQLAAAPARTLHGHSRSPRPPQGNARMAAMSSGKVPSACAPGQAAECNTVVFHFESLVNCMEMPRQQQNNKTNATPPTTSKPQARPSRTTNDHQPEPTTTHCKSTHECPRRCAARRLRNEGSPTGLWK